MKKPTKAQQAEQREAIEAKRIEMATAPNPQTGMAELKEEMPTAKEAKAALEQQFAEADARHDPEVADATLSRQIRGY